MEDIGMIQKLRNIRERVGDKLRLWLGRYITLNEKQQTRVRHILATLGEGLAAGTLAFLASRAAVAGGSHPFALSLLTAAGRRTPFLLLGVLVSTLTGAGDGISLIASVLIVVLRLLVGYLFGGRRATLFREPIAIRLAIGSVGGFVVGLYGIFAGGFEKELLWKALFLIAAVPLLALLYEGASHSREDRSLRRDAGILAVLYTVLLSLSDVVFYGFSLSLTAAFYLTLLSAVAGGALRGGMVGMIGGFACGVSYSPALGLAGILAGGFKKRGTAMAALMAGSVAIAVSLTFDRLSAFFSTVPAVTAAMALYLPTAKLGLAARLSPFAAEGTVSETTATAALVGLRREEEAKRRLDALSEAMSSLSGVFYALSNRLMTPGTYEMRELCEKAFREYCGHCRQNGLCWGQEYDRTADIMNRLASAVVRHGSAEASYVPSEFLERCPHAAKAIAAVNISHARLLENAVRGNKTEIFALDYEAIAALLASATEETAAEYQPDADRTEQVRRAARQMGMAVNNIAVYGKRRKTVLAGGVALSQLALTAEEMQSRLSEACGCRLTVPEFKVDGDYVTVTATAARILSCETARASVRKEDEQINGDSAVVFENREDRFYALISDGMGSGRDAAITSRMTCIILEKLLAAGNRKNTVLKMLNHFIRHKNMECFATVDLLEIDLLNGEASFIKSGAAASYVLREGKLFKIASQSLPIGITREITAEEIRFSLQVGDLVVMISDGISQSFEDGVWLLDLLANRIDADSSLSSIAQTILQTAGKKNERSDDMTVTVLRIHAA